MGLKIKNLNEILNSLITWVTSKSDKITDFNAGSAISTLLESISLQLEEYYFDMRNAVLYAIENAVFYAFGFEKTQSEYAKGEVTLTFKQPLPAPMVIPKGTVFSTGLESSRVVYYKSLESVVAPAGALTAKVPIQCTEAGEIGNVADNKVTICITTNPFILSCTNEVAISSGKEQETDSELKNRFTAYIHTLSKATAEAIAYGAKSVAGVAGVYVDDNYIGMVKVYVHDSNGDLPEALKQAVLTELVNWRAAGIEVEVMPVVKKYEDMIITLVIADDYPLEVAATDTEDKIKAYLQALTVHKDFYVSEIVAMIMAQKEYGIINVDIQKGSDMTTLDNEIVKAGKIEVSSIHLSDWRN